MAHSVADVSLQGKLNIYIEVSTKPAAVDAEVYIASSNNGTYTVSSYRIDPFGKTNFSLGVTQETEKPVRV